MRNARKMTGFEKHFGSIPDPRIDRTKEHKLIDILFITLSAVICGCEDWNAIERYAKSKEQWLRKHLELPNGIPSHDTINRVISLLEPAILQERFIQWVQTVVSLKAGDVVSVDGKRLCGSGKDGLDAIVHMVTAWSSANNMVLGGYKVDDKSNEITAIPQLLEMLELKDCTLTIDAMGCQKEIAKKIVDKGAHYILAVKDNQQRLFDDIKEAFEHEPKSAIVTHTEKNMGHGRIEKRTCRVITNMDWVCQKQDWKELKSIIEITAERTDKKSGVKQKELRYYISDMHNTPVKFNSDIREHWGIENKQHWTLDIAFGEDDSKKRAGNAAENFAILNRMALNIVKQDTTAKVGVKTRRMMAGWDDGYLNRLLVNMKI